MAIGQGGWVQKKTPQKVRVGAQSGPWRSYLWLEKLGFYASGVVEIGSKSLKAPDGLGLSGSTCLQSCGHRRRCFQTAG